MGEVDGTARAAGWDDPVLSDSNARAMLANGNRMKLGLFMSNCDAGGCLTNAPTTTKVTWPHTKSIARQADELGLDLLLPLSRWKGFGGSRETFRSSFEPMMWAAGIAEATENVTIVSTVLCPAFHPVAAAKMAATIDHIAEGRFALNAVMGWFAPDSEAFGIEILEHDDRYKFGDEWTEVLKKVWTEPEEFDFEGRFFDLKNVLMEPKPIQDPYPVFINAGNSPAGMDFAAREADVNFAQVQNLPEGKAYIDRARAHAKDKYDRDISILTNGFVICRETEAEAKAAYDDMIEQGDWEAYEILFGELTTNSGSVSEEAKKAAEPWLIGQSAYQFVGTPDQVATQIAELGEIGIDGVVVSFLDTNEELPFFGREVVPRLEAMGLREPFVPGRAPIPSAAGS